MRSEKAKSKSTTRDEPRCIPCSRSAVLPETWIIHLLFRCVGHTRTHILPTSCHFAFALLWNYCTAKARHELILPPPVLRCIDQIPDQEHYSSSYRRQPFPTIWFNLDLGGSQRPRIRACGLTSRHRESIPERRPHRHYQIFQIEMSVWDYVFASSGNCQHLFSSAARRAAAEGL